ncbi:hypothetical protein Lser_V15G09233 [Lactuca serriola]
MKLLIFADKSLRQKIASITAKDKINKLNPKNPLQDIHENVAFARLLHAPHDDADWWCAINMAFLGL